MKTLPLLKKTLPWLLAATAVATAPAALAAGGMDQMVLEDSLTGLKIDWMWSDAGTSNYSGTYWNAWLTRTLDGHGDWQVDVGYLHLQGPHGEGVEHPAHAMGYTITPGGSAIDGGTQDHFGTSYGAPAAHAGAHQWDFATWTQTDPGQGGFTAFSVAHVPEPATWLMLAGGLALVGARRLRRS